MTLFPGNNSRSFKKPSGNNVIKISSGGSRLPATSGNGPPLPPANHIQQHALLKKTHPQQQLQQPENICPTLVSQSQTKNMGPIGRNISAMLDENNTVRCYLEPLNK